MRSKVHLRTRFINYTYVKIQTLTYYHRFIYVPNPQKVDLQELHAPALCRLLLLVHIASPCNLRKNDLAAIQNVWMGMVSGSFRQAKRLTSTPFLIRVFRDLLSYNFILSLAWNAKGHIYNIPKRDCLPPNSGVHDDYR